MQNRRQWLVSVSLAKSCPIQRHVVHGVVGRLRVKGVCPSKIGLIVATSLPRLLFVPFVAIPARMTMLNFFSSNLSLGLEARPSLQKSNPSSAGSLLSNLQMFSALVLASSSGSGLRVVTIIIQLVTTVKLKAQNWPDHCTVPLVCVIIQNTTSALFLLMSITDVKQMLAELA